MYVWIIGPILGAIAATYVNMWIGSVQEEMSKQVAKQ